MSDDIEPTAEPVTEELRTAEFSAPLELRDAAKRELDIFIVPWNTVIDTNAGPEMFARGAFDEVTPDTVRLRMDHQDPPTGKGYASTNQADGQHMSFRVSKTQRGDDQMTLLRDGIANGASVGFMELPGGTTVESMNGRRVRVHRRVDLREVSTTWLPAYERAAVMAIRSQAQGDAAMADEPTAVAVSVEPAPPPVQHDFSAFDKAVSGMNSTVTSLVERIEKMEERSRSEFIIPAPNAASVPEANIGTWANIVLRMLSGENVPKSELQLRTVQDLITSDNAGVVPEAFVSELRGVIDPARPFMESTRRLPVPANGTSMRVPIITQRPSVAEQTSEKQELSSQKTIIGSDTFDMVSKGGVGDISLQLLKRSDPSFLDLYVRLLAEAYAIEAEDEALRALFDAVGGGVTAASPMDPEALSLGAAFQTSFDAIRRPPDTIWLSTEAVGEFIDAKASTSNQPLYSNITTSATAAGGISGTISGLRAVHVPGLDAHGAFAVVGPSSGFAWAEDGTYTLQVDVPSKAGRDVAIFGMLWFIPWYPEAFTLYNVAS